MERPMSIKVLLVDDHPVVLDALRFAVDRHDDFDVYCAATTSEAREALHTLKPEVVVCDVRMPDGSGLRVIEEARSIDGGAACLVLSSFDSPQYVATARRLGAAGYLLKTEPTDGIIDAIRTIARGGTAFGPGIAGSAEGFKLTRRERDVVAGVVMGLTNDEIAGRLGITRKGVEAHLGRLFNHIGISSRTELAVRAEREGWLDAV
jgi:DNA-binding NarL/FixJ family response regulator